MTFLFKRRRVMGVYDAAEYQREALLADEQRMVNALLKSYRVAEKDIEARLAKIIAKVAKAKAGGVEPSPYWIYQETRFESFLASIHQEIGRFSRDGSEVVQAHKAANVLMAIANAAELGEIGGVPVGTWIRMPSQSVEHIVGQLRPGAPLYDLFNELPGKAVIGARRSFAIGLAAGDNPRVIARSLMKEVEGLTRDRAVLIARTETIRAYRYAALDSYRANADVVKGWRWLSARDGRCCPICIAMDGSEHTLGEPLESHPGCRCTQVPMLRFLDTNIGTGPEWFDKQDRQVQLRVMQGSERRLQLYEDGMPLEKMVAPTHHPRWGGGKRLVALRDL